MKSAFIKEQNPKKYNKSDGVKIVFPASNERSAQKKARDG